MHAPEQTTLALIHEAARKEFMDKGFQSASLRNIVKAAGVTTGAFYGYYRSKEELFDALVGEHYRYFMDRYTGALNTFALLPPEMQREQVGKISGDTMEEVTEYAYQHLDAFKLLLCGAEGTKYEHMIHDMVEAEVEATHAFARVLEGMGAPKYDMDPTLEHMLVSGFFAAYFELLIHDVPYEKATAYLRQLKAYSTAGWQAIMGF